LGHEAVSVSDATSGQQNVDPREREALPFVRLSHGEKRVVGVHVGQALKTPQPAVIGALGQVLERVLEQLGRQVVARGNERAPAPAEKTGKPDQNEKAATQLAIAPACSTLFPATRTQRGALQNPCKSQVSGVAFQCA
jgi:hypothetical protein